MEGHCQISNELVSVLLPVHKNNQHLSEAILSILNQSHSNLELLILDNSQKGISEYVTFSDPRLRIIKLPSNYGLSEALNYGIKVSKGTYIARMDYDDIAIQSRLELQANFLDCNPDVGILGGYIRFLGKEFDPKARVGAIQVRPTSSLEMKRYLLHKNPLFHPTVMFRASEIRKLREVYRKKYNSCEDLDLWSRAVFKVSISNLPEVVLEYRLHEDQYSRKARPSTLYLANKVRTQHALRLFLSERSGRMESMRCVLVGISKFPGLFYSRFIVKKFDKFVS